MSEGAVATSDPIAPAPTPSEQAILESANPLPGSSPAPTRTDASADPAEPPHAIEEHRKYVREHGRRAAAKPADVPAIRSLAALVKELTPANEADAPRIKELKSKVRAALELDTPAPKDETPTAAPVQSLPPPVVVPQDFSDRAPVLDDFVGKSDDPYAAHLRALTAYDRRKESHEAQRAYALQQQAAQQQAAQQAWSQVVSDHNARMATAKQQHADWDQVVSGAQATTLLNHAVIAMPNSHDATYFLAKHPDLLNELNLQSLALSATPVSLDLLQKRILSRMTAGTTGAAAPARPVLVAPRAPTPVRTGPMRTGEASPPDETSDLEAHRAYYGVGGSRRRR